MSTQGDRPSSPLDTPLSPLGESSAPLAPREPEKLVIPAGAVGDLLVMALRSPEGNAWWRGFVTAHGEPSWIVAGAWAIQAPGQGVEIVRVPPGAGAPRNGRG